MTRWLVAIAVVVLGCSAEPSDAAEGSSSSNITARTESSRDVAQVRRTLPSQGAAALAPHAPLQLVLGEVCFSPAPCGSGSCVDNVCCDSPCGGTCQACTAAKKGGGVDGTCGNVAAGGDPDSECNADLPSSCNNDGACNGAGACRLYPAGVVCGSSTCASGAQTGYACNGLGTCSTGATVQCAPYVCSAGACLTSCSDDTQCMAGHYCGSNSQCMPAQSNGGACAANSQCSSGHCVDGVCCDTACSGTCQACSASKKGNGTEGTCGPTVAGMDPDDDCTTESPSICGRSGACNGSGACALYGPGTSCGTTTCGGGTSSTLVGDVCDGFGTCRPGTTTSCDPYVCTGQSSCKTACSTNADCVAGFFCKASQACVRQVTNATACTQASECQSGFCVEGLCCDSACDGVCQACTAANKLSGPDGACGNAKAGVDPHGDCDPEDASTCGKDGTCDGNGACRLYAAGTACGATACNANVQTGYACDGTGTCNPNATVDCGLYACSGAACNTICTADGECASGAFCDTQSGVCTPKAAPGDACTTPSTCQSGFCVDGVCCDSACTGQCEACDVPTSLGSCVPIYGPPHGVRQACDDGGSQPCQGRVCDGAVSVTTCAGYVGSQVACRDASCDAGTHRAVFSATCDGKGTCPAEVTVDCGASGCDGTACRASCSTDADCTTGAHCAAGSCVTGGTCDGSDAVGANGTHTSCAPYQCAGGLCKTSCVSDTDCASGYQCGATYRCLEVTGQHPVSDDQGGCGCRTAGSPRGSGYAWAALALAVASLRRRRTARISRAEQTLR